ncbi:MAG: hypothetical protein OIF58_04815, partial [Cohaesibacter sp.]|nr:hypothetical protein [Cohaesibacter sp.]
FVGQALNDEQIDAVSSVARQLQRMWSKHEGSELLPSSWDGENLQVMFLGGKTHTVLRAIKPLIECVFWPRGIWKTMSKQC